MYDTTMPNEISEVTVLASAGNCMTIYVKAWHRLARKFCKDVDDSLPYSEQLYLRS